MMGKQRSKRWSPNHRGAGAKHHNREYYMAAEIGTGRKCLHKHHTRASAKRCGEHLYSKFTVRRYGDKEVVADTTHSTGCPLTSYKPNDKMSEVGQEYI